MNITLSIDEQVVARARERASAMGMSLNQMVREYLAQVSGDLEVERENAAFEKRCGLGNSNGWKFNRDELYERR